MERSSRPWRSSSVRVKRILSSLVGLVLLGGCSATNISELVKAMANSQRSYCYTERSIYVQLNLSGTGIQNGSVTCNADGTMTVKSDGATVK